MRRSSLFHAFGGSDDVKTAVKCMTEAGFLEEYKKGGAFCLRRADGAAEDTIDAALKKLLEDHRRVQAVLAAMDPAPKIRPAKSAPAPLPALAASAEGEAENTGESVHAQKKKGLSCTSIILCILLILAACFLFSLWSGLLFLALLFFVFQK